MKVGVITPQAISLKNVGRDIALVVEKCGYAPMLFDHTITASDALRFFNNAVIVTWGSPLTSTPYWLMYLDFKNAGIDSILYITVEGRMKQHHVQLWMKRDLEFIANSKYVAKKLREVGLHVKDIVPHGINLELVEDAKLYAREMRRRIIGDVKDKVIFVTVASALPRKSLDILGKAITIAFAKNQDVLFVVWSTPRAREMIPNLPCVKLVTEFGNATREEVLGLIACAHWLIHPATGEGFGLPVLEAMALGVPVIHVDHPAIMEFTEPEANLIMRFERIRYLDCQDGILYELFMYKPEALAEKILEAVDIVKNRREEYEERRRRVQEHAKKYDINIVYRRLLKHIGL